jgi:pyridoxamine 5'-phosphate oxidase
VPLPPHWGGYRVVPETIELWEHREDRLHDRVLYTRGGDGWRKERLAP